MAENSGGALSELNFLETIMRHLKMAVAKTRMVEGYAQMWPREVFDARDGVALLVRKKNFLDQPGVYILYRDDQSYYIGKTQRPLARRIWAHANRPRDRYYNFWNLFSAFVVQDKNQRNELEGILIAAMPTANSANPRLTRIKLPSEVAKMMRRIRQNRVKE